MRFFDYGRGGRGWGGFHHPQLTADQQAARRAVETAQEQLDAQLQTYQSQFRSWRAQADAAAQAGTTTMPSLPSPPSLSSFYAALVAAEQQSKTADAAAAQAATSPPAAAASPSAA